MKQFIFLLNVCLMHFFFGASSAYAQDNNSQNSLASIPKTSGNKVTFKRVYLATDVSQTIATQYLFLGQSYALKFLFTIEPKTSADKKKYCTESPFEFIEVKLKREILFIATKNSSAQNNTNIQNESDTINNDNTHQANERIFLFTVKKIGKGSCTYEATSILKQHLRRTEFPRNTSESASVNLKYFYTYDKFKLFMTANEVTGKSKYLNVTEDPNQTDHKFRYIETDDKNNVISLPQASNTEDKVNKLKKIALNGRTYYAIAHVHRTFAATNTARVVIDFKGWRFLRVPPPPLIATPESKTHHGVHGFFSTLKKFKSSKPLNISYKLTYKDDASGIKAEKEEQATCKLAFGFCTITIKNPIRATKSNTVKITINNLPNYFNPLNSETLKAGKPEGLITFGHLGSHPRILARGEEFR